jgi:hypothetical protein
MKDKFKELQGKTINKISVFGNNEYLRFHLQDGDVDFHAYGDCCSESWIEHFSTPTEPEVIISFNKVEIPVPHDPQPTVHDHSEEEMKYNFYELTTSKGKYLIEMRNSSNGYYGGWLE